MVGLWRHNYRRSRVCSDKPSVSEGINIACDCKDLTEGLKLVSDAINNGIENQLIIRRIELTCSRRDFFKVGIGAFSACLLPLPALAAAITKPDAKRHLAFYNTHTGESTDTCYYDQGNYCPKALNRINHILRDHRTNDIKPIDLQLLDHLHALKLKIGATSPFHVISGYRSPTTNAMLRKITNGVARTSYHLQGKAIDIRLPGYNTRRLRNACISLQAGGVGYYKDSNFVHLDTGPIRSW
jgi:uncharacterized protein YcbK (DUF882 family)